MKKVLHDAILNGLYDQNFPGNENYSPRLLTNNQDQNIWLNLRRELLNCTSFTWAIAFITQDMLVPFKLVMADLAKKGVSGTIVTSDYLGFNNPKVFSELAKIPNLTVRISNQAGFHVKGYLFEHEECDTILIGSANFTRSALLANYEWTLRISSLKDASLSQEIKAQLKLVVNHSPLLSDEWLEQYRANWSKGPAINYQNNISQEITPNKMQKAALKNLEELVKAGQKRALVVSSTGTGKTYLGAFAVKNYCPKRFLYLVHRRQIAQKSLTSFKQVIGQKEADFGLLSGEARDKNKQYLFATIQTMSQDSVLKSYAPDYFDYILIDEAHRSAADSYQKILNYFKPKFCLGMTATPERMDQQNVYQIFDYNLAYEIRLKDALKEKMLSPFHYVGIEDYVQDGQVIDETTNLRYLSADKRVDYVLKQLDYYGFCGQKACGLVFCSRQEEARIIAQKFTQRGHLAQALTNQDSEKRRQKAIDALKQGRLEYIISVDLFNEGIDIPQLNQIVMLRNTKSSIVFIQQLGRGLRKYPGKDFVTVIDFIGNYKNNYLIPLALNGDRSCERDLARRETKLPSFVGLSTINFSQIASTKILESLSQIKLDGLREIRQAYTSLKEKIGRVPLLCDFDHYGTISPEVLINQASLKHYGYLLQKMGESVELTRYEDQVLNFVTKELANGKRPHELLLVKMLLNKRSCTENDFQKTLVKNHAYCDDEVIKSVDKILSLAFFDVKAGKTTRKNDYGNLPIVLHQKNYQLAPKILTSLKNPTFKLLFEDAINLGLSLSKNYNSQAQFSLYQKYNRQDVCRLLNWPKDVSAPMYGYRVEEAATPIFITYKKESQEKRNAIYNNSLQNGQSLRWYTRSPRHLDSPEVQKLLHNKQMKLHLFVKRSDSFGKNFYYLGEAKILADSVSEEKIGPKQKAVVGMDLLLKKPLSATMYALLFDK